MCIWSFSTTFVWNVSHSKKKWARNDKKCILVCMYIRPTLNFCPILMKLEFSWQIFEKSTNIKFHGSPSSGSRVVPWERTDMTKLTVAFYNFPNAPKNRCCLTSITGWLYHKKCSMTHITRTYLFPLNHSNASGPTQISVHALHTWK
jgi:hypothetical protein